MIHFVSMGIFVINLESNAYFVVSCIGLSLKFSRTFRFEFFPNQKNYQTKNREWNEKKSMEAMVKNDHSNVSKHLRAFTCFSLLHFWDSDSIGACRWLNTNVQFFDDCNELLRQHRMIRDRYNYEISTNNVIFDVLNHKSYVQQCLLHYAVFNKQQRYFCSIFFSYVESFFVE